MLPVTAATQHALPTPSYFYSTACCLCRAIATLTHLVLWPVILRVTRSQKRTKDVTRRVFESPNAFGSRALPGPAGGDWVLPTDPSCNWGGMLLGEWETVGEGIASSLFNFWLRACFTAWSTTSLSHWVAVHQTCQVVYSIHTFHWYQPCIN